MNKINIILFLILIVLLMFYCNTKLFKNNMENYNELKDINIKGIITDKPELF